MRTGEWVVIVAAALSGACGKAGGDGAAGVSPDVSLPDASTSTDASAPRDGQAADDASATGAAEALRDRLTASVVPLGQAPFGTAVAVTAVRGSLEVRVTRGTLWDGGPDADDETLFDVASVSKVLTAARVVSLAHEGKLGLDDPLGVHLPGVNLVGVDGGEPQPVVTIRHLLMHRSGLPHAPPDLAEHVGNDWTSADLLQRITASWEIRLVGQPGEYRYSNLGYALLGAIVEVQGGCSFADCMGGYLKALGMGRSAFWPGYLDDNAARGHVYGQEPAKVLPPSWYGSRYAIPFTGLWTTMPELAGVGLALVTAATDPASPLHAMTVGQGHGLGPIHGSRLGAPSLEHDGSGPGFYAALVVVPDRQIVVAIVTNGGSESKGEVETFTQVVNAAVEAVPDP